MTRKLLVVLLLVLWEVLLAVLLAVLTQFLRPVHSPCCPAPHLKENGHCLPCGTWLGALPCWIRESPCRTIRIEPEPQQQSSQQPWWRPPRDVLAGRVGYEDDDAVHVGLGDR